MPDYPETIRRQWQLLRMVPRFPRKIAVALMHERLSAEGWTVSRRTIERDLQALSTIFPLVVDDRSKPFGWSWDKDAPAFDLPGLMPSEALTLLMARDHLRAVLPSSTMGQLEGHFRQAEQCIKATADRAALLRWRDKVRLVQPTQPLQAPAIDTDVLASLQQALLLDRQCQVSYRKRGAEVDESYLVNPLGLVQRGQLIYLVVTIKTYVDVRLLVLHRVRSAEVSDLPVIRPDGFSLDDYLASGGFGWGAGPAVPVELIFNADAVSHLHETPLTSDQVISPLADGRWRVSATLPSTQQLRWWLLAFGDGVEVVAPPELRASIAATARAMAATYV